MRLSAYIEGVGVLGPGLCDWRAAEAVLRGRAPYVPAPTVLPTPELLPPAERRRTGRVVKVALAVAAEAAQRAGVDAAGLPSVFCSSGGDGQNCHEICQTLATVGRELSPTRFANSVHNAAAGYWSIATGAMTASNVICAFDASFAAGLLEAVTQVAVETSTTLLVAYDTEYPAPLHAKRPIPDAFAIALVLAPAQSAVSTASLSLSFTNLPAQVCDDAPLEALRSTIPAARGLPLLRALSRREPGHCVLEYLDDLRLRVDVAPCL
jgi:hypothetical protein